MHFFAVPPCRGTNVLDPGSAGQPPLAGLRGAGHPCRLLVRHFLASEPPPAGAARPARVRRGRHPGAPPLRGLRGTCAATILKFIFR